MGDTDRRAIPVIFGPTAVGKSAAVGAVAGPRDEVVSADALQVYRHLDLGTAKPTRAERARFRHHLIDVADPGEQFDAGRFVRRAERALADVTARGRRALVVGGCAYYLRSLVCGLPDSPRGDPAIRAGLTRRLRVEGRQALRRELQAADPESARRIHANDSYRIVRALEVLAAAGRPLSSFRVPDRPADPGRFRLIGLQRPREELARRIDARVDAMRAAGLAEEVRVLLARGYPASCPGLRGIGYRELAAALTAAGEVAPPVWDAIKRNTRRYAKRQMTFFRSLPGVRWIAADDRETLRELIDGAADRPVDSGRPSADTQPTIDTCNRSADALRS